MCWPPWGWCSTENAIATLGVLYGGDAGASLVEAIARSVSPAAGRSFLVTTMLFIPCVATVAVMHQETCSWQWGTAKTSELARELSVSPQLVSALLEALVHHGYLKPVLAECSVACTHCPLRVACAYRRQPRIWVLTRKHELDFPVQCRMSFFNNLLKKLKVLHDEDSHAR